MERDKKSKSKNVKDSDYSDNNIHVNINVGKSDNHKEDNSVINDVKEIKEIKEKKIDDKKEIDNTGLLLSELKKLIKEFNLKKENLINKKIDIPNNIFDLPSIEINSKEDIIRFSDILREKIKQLNNILINVKPKKQFQSQQQQQQPLPINPFANNFQTNMRNPMNPMYPGFHNPYVPFPTNTRTPETPVTPTVTPPVTPETPPVTPIPETPETTPSELTETQKEIEQNLLMFLEEDFGKYEKYYFDNKDTTDMVKLRKLIQIQENEIERLKKIKNDLFLEKNKNKVDEIIIEVQGNKSNTNIALRDLMDIKPDDGGEENDFDENQPPYQEPIADPDLVNRKNTLLAYKSRMFNTERSPNGFLLIDRELNNNLDYINNGIQKEGELSKQEKDYILSLYNIMDNSQGLFEPAKAYRNTHARVLSKTDVLTLELFSGDKYILMLNGNQEIIDNETGNPLRFDINGDIYNTNVQPPTPDPGDGDGGSRRPGIDDTSEPPEPEQEFPNDGRINPDFGSGSWWDRISGGFFGTGDDGNYQDGL